MHRLLLDFLTFVGITNGSGRWYLFWSGIFADITLFAAGVAIYRKHMCHVHGCWRWQRHAVAGTPYVTCRKHHPDAPDDRHAITAEHIAAVAAANR